MINSARPSASVFPPPHLIITRNAHGAEEAEWAWERGYHKIARQFLHYNRYRVACGFERPLPSIYMHVYTLYMYVRTICIRSIRNKRHTNFGEDLVTPRLCRRSRDKFFQAFSLFPPPNLIITRNAHGAEEGEGLGTRLAETTCIGSGSSQFS